MNKRLLLFMTSLSLSVAMPLQMTAYASEYTGPAVVVPLENRASLTASTGEYRTWKQGDSRWGSMRLGSSSDSMAESGCLVTAIATLMVHTGCADESNMSPGILCEYLSGNGGFTSYGELYWAKINGAAPGFTLSNWKVTLSGSASDKAATIADYVSRGYAVVVNVSYGAHWVAVDSVSGSSVKIMDPAYSVTDLFSGYSADGVDRIAVFSANGNGGGVIGGGGGNSAAIPDFNAKGKVNVGASYLNVRTGAGTDKSYLKDSSGKQITLQNNADVTITGKTTDGDGNLWYRISVNGYTGYVFGSYVTLTSEGGGDSYEAKDGVVNASSVNVRSGAGTGNGIVKVANKNDKVKIIGEAKDSAGSTWYKVEINGTTGYIISDYVTLGSDSNSSGGEYETKDGKVNASSVNVRSGAGTNNSVVTVLSAGAAVKVTGEAKDSAGAKWYKITYSGGSGYIHSDYITLTNSSSGGSNYESKDGYVNGNSVNVRSGAGTGNGIVKVANKNDKVKIIGEAKDGSGSTWYKVEIGGTTGYIISDYVTVGTSGNENNNNSGSYEEKDGKVNASSVNIRSGAGTNNSVVTMLSTGTAVKVVGEEKDSTGAKWYKITYSGGSGYIHSDYVTIGSDGGGSAGGETMNKKGTVNDDYVNVRSGAGTGNSRVTSLNKGTAVTVIGEEKDSAGAKWYKINYSGGSGYMHSDYITLEGEGSGNSDNSNNSSNNNNSGNSNVSDSADVIGKEAIVNVPKVNVRSGVGTNNSVLTELTEGVSIIVEGVEKDGEGEVWYKVAFSGTSGYMYGKYLDVQ